MDLYVVKLPLLRTYNEKNTINTRYLSIEMASEPSMDKSLIGIIDRHSGSVLY